MLMTRETDLSGSFQSNLVSVVLSAKQLTMFQNTPTSEIMRVPVIIHPHGCGISTMSSASYDSAYESKSDSESSNSSLDVGSGKSSSPTGSSSPARSVRCKWSECGQLFSHLDELAAHVTSLHAHSGPGGLFFCGWEGCSRGQRGFNARYKMLVHVRTHTNEKPHRCFQCDKSFSRAENLKIHARSHTGERPYVCPVPGCSKAYSNSSDRFKHTRTHKEDKPYTCKVRGCGKRYTDPSSLRKHVKTYRHFRAADASDVTRTEIPYEEEPEHEQIVPEADEAYARLYGNIPPYVPDVRYVNTWLSSDLTHGMQWEQSALWHHPIEATIPTLNNRSPWITSADLDYRMISEHDMPLDLSIHK